MLPVWQEPYFEIWRLRNIKANACHRFEFDKMFGKVTKFEETKYGDRKDFIYYGLV